MKGGTNYYKGNSQLGGINDDISIEELKKSILQSIGNLSPLIQGNVKDTFDLMDKVRKEMMENEIEEKIRPVLENIIDNKKGDDIYDLMINLAEVHIKMDNLLREVNERDYIPKNSLYHNVYMFYLESGKQILRQKIETFPQELLVAKVKEMYETYFPKTNQEPIQNNVKITK